MMTFPAVIHPKATALALCLYAYHVGRDEIGGVEAVCTSIDNCTDYDDERKADLYARIAESVKSTSTYGQMEKAISVALHGNDAAFGFNQ